MFVMDADTPGIEILRPMQVFGHDDAPHGHMHLRFTNVRLPCQRGCFGRRTRV
jgi:acyl-CoA dehydrogenase